MTPSRTILIDLRCAQFNGDRGIPAYSQSLALELTRRYPRHRWHLLHNPGRPEPGRAAELAEHARWLSVADLAGPQPPRIDALLTGCFFLPHRSPTAADFLLPPPIRRQQPHRLGIVYDLIPLLFADHYFKDDRVRRHYLDALRVMRQSDHLFAISRASRLDAIRHAAVDPRRVHCIYGDIDHVKRELMARPAAATVAVPGRHGLRRPYAIFIGGDDWRKNLLTMIRAFALFHSVHPDRQLAVVCKLEPARIAELVEAAAAAGLPREAVVFTGMVSTEDLIGLVRHAELLVFPSLYEGLGLPVLEAYGCGTPAVASAGSSLAELVPPELACDPEDPRSIAAAMARLVASRQLREASLAFGRRLLATELGWPAAAARVIEQIEGRPAARGSRPLVGRHRLAVVSDVSARADEAAGLVTAGLPAGSVTTRYELADRSGPDADPPGPPRAGGVRPVEILPAALLRGLHDTVIFVAGHSPDPERLVAAVMRSRGTAARRLLRLTGPTPDLPGLQVLLERGEFDGLVVDTPAAGEHLRARLGPLAERLPITAAGVVEPVRAAIGPGRAAACSPGAA
jgi:glycosyltransferase involved in cell wall biosynthesis